MSAGPLELRRLFQRQWRISTQLIRSRRGGGKIGGGKRHLQVDITKQQASIAATAEQASVEILFTSLHREAGRFRHHDRSSFPIASVLADFSDSLRGRGRVLSHQVWQQIINRLVDEGYIATPQKGENLSEFLRSARDGALPLHEGRTTPTRSSRVGRSDKPLTPLDIGLLGRLMAEHCQAENVHAAQRCWNELLHTPWAWFSPANTDGKQPFRQPHLHQILSHSVMSHYIRLLRETRAYYDGTPARLLNHLDALNARTRGHQLYHYVPIQLAILNYIASAPAEGHLDQRSISALQQMFSKATQYPKPRAEYRNAVLCCLLYFDPDRLTMDPDDQVGFRMEGRSAERYSLMAIRIVVRHIEGLRSQLGADGEVCSSGNAPSSPSIKSTQAEGKKGTVKEKSRALIEERLVRLQSFYADLSSGKLSMPDLGLPECLRATAGELLAVALEVGKREDIVLAMNRLIRVLGRPSPETWTLAEMGLHLRAKAAHADFRPARLFIRKYCRAPEDLATNEEGHSMSPLIKPRASRVTSIHRFPKNNEPYSSERQVGINPLRIRDVWPSKARGKVRDKPLPQDLFTMDTSVARTLAKVCRKIASRLAERTPDSLPRVPPELKAAFALTMDLFHSFGFAPRDISAELHNFYSTEEVEDFIRRRRQKVRGIENRTWRTGRRDAFTLGQRLSGSFGPIGALEEEERAISPAEELKLAEGGHLGLPEEEDDVFVRRSSLGAPSSIPMPLTDGMMYRPASMASAPL